LTSILVSVLVVILGILMVSRLRYRSFKEIGLHSRVSWMVVSVMAVAYFVVAASPQVLAVVLSFAYLLSGLVPRRPAASRPETRPAAEEAHGDR
jgi:CDP-diacylglycerol--serine O-phosphatidyltransferase